MYEYVCIHMYVHHFIYMYTHTHRHPDNSQADLSSNLSPYPQLQIICLLIIPIWMRTKYLSFNRAKRERELWIPPGSQIFSFLISPISVNSTICPLPRGTNLGVIIEASLP